MQVYLGAAKCIISTAQQARPNVIGHKEPCRNIMNNKFFFPSWSLWISKVHVQLKTNIMHGIIHLWIIQDMDTKVPIILGILIFYAIQRLFSHGQVWSLLCKKGYSQYTCNMRNEKIIRQHKMFNSTNAIKE